MKVILHPINKGLAPSRNDGLAVARGRFIYFLDSDDTLSSDCLQKLYDLALKDHADVVCGTVWSYAENKNDFAYRKRSLNMNRWLAFKPFSKKHIDTENFGAFYHTFNCLACNKLFRTQFLKKNNLCFIHQNCFHEDNGFWLKVLSCFPIVSALSDVTYYYRLKSDSITSQTRRNKSVRLKHVKNSLLDALYYVQQKNQPRLEKFIQAEIYKCEKHRLVAWFWAEQEKYLKVFNFPVFVLKVNYASRIYVLRFLGITLYKRKINYD